MAKAKKEDKLAAFGVDSASIAKLAETKREGEQTLAFIERAEINSETRLLWASEQMANIRAMHKSLDEQRTSITKPILEGKRAVDKLFSPTLDLFERAEGLLRAKMREFEARKLRDAMAAQAEAAKAFEAGDVDAGNAALDRAPAPTADAGGHTTSLWWSWAVADFAALSDDHKVVNAKSIDAAIKAHLATGSTEPPSIPGLTFTVDAKLRAKGV